MSFKKVINKMTVGQKVMTVIFVEIVSYTLITVIAISQISSLGTEVKRMSDLYLLLFSSTEAIRQHIQDMRLSLKEIIFIGDRVVYDKDTEAKYNQERARYTVRYIQILNEVDTAEDLIDAAVSEGVGDRSVIRKFSKILLPQLESVRRSSKSYNADVEKLFLHIEFGSYLMGMEMIGESVSSEKELNSELGSRLIQIQ